MIHVFLSYRRSDSSDIVGRIFDHLKATFGAENLFKDVDSIPLGEDFRKAVSDAVSQCDVLLAIIGEDWLKATDATGRHRIDDPNDFVHLEIATALRRGIPVIPVLVRNTPLPKESDLPPALKDLAYRNAATVRNDPDFRTDIERLQNQIGAYIKVEQRRQTTSWCLSKAKVAVFSGLLALGAVISSIITQFAGPHISPHSSTQPEGSITPTIEHPAEAVVFIHLVNGYRPQADYLKDRLQKAGFFVKRIVQHDEVSGFGSNRVVYWHKHDEGEALSVREALLAAGVTEISVGIGTVPAKSSLRQYEVWLENVDELRTQGNPITPN